MGIRRGEAWEEPLATGTEVVVVDGDAAAAAVIERSLGSAADPPTIHITAGDVSRSLGGALAVEDPGDRLRCRMDAVLVQRVDGAGGPDAVAVGHVVARRPWWIGRFTVVMNTTHLGEMNLGPRAHPGDGRLDVTEGRLRPVERWQARRRAPSGSHVPHPALDTRRVRSEEVRVPRGASVYVDGRRVGRGPATWSFEVLPGAWWWTPHLPP